MNCLQYTLKHYSDDFYYIYIPICMNVYLELFWVLFKLTCSFKKFICSATLRILYLPLYFKICLSTLQFKIVFFSQNYGCTLMGSFPNCSFDRVQNYIILYKVGRSCGRFFALFLYMYICILRIFSDIDFVNLFVDLKKVLLGTCIFKYFYFDAVGKKLSLEKAVIYAELFPHVLNDVHEEGDVRSSVTCGRMSLYYLISQVLQSFYMYVLIC